MRELTLEEMELIAGGYAGDSEKPWWEEAFSWMSDSLNFLGDIFGGWLGDYLGMWADLTDEMSVYGGEVNCWDDYTDYQIDYATGDGGGGEYYETFQEWFENTDPSTCDTDSDPNSIN